MCKRRVELPAGTDVTALFANLEREVASLNPLTEDGLKIDFEDSWVQIRPSNTEPIVRVYTEAPTELSLIHISPCYFAQGLGLAQRSLSLDASL